MARYPADIGRAPENVIIVDIKDIFKSQGDVEKISGGGMHHTLRFARSSTGVEDEKRVLGIHLLSFAGVGDVVGRHFLVPPEISAGHHVRRAVTAVENNDFLDAIALGDGCIHLGLQV